MVACDSIHMHVLTSATELCMYEVPGCFQSHSDTQLLAAAQPCSLACLLIQPMATLHVMLDCCGSPTQLCFTKTGSDHIICRLCQLLILWSTMLAAQVMKITFCVFTWNSFGASV